ncbi:MAG: hypothetical protein ACYSTS_18925, partial [Planctomycetota bacterium]|jgi:hypothetical protein
MSKTKKLNEYEMARELMGKHGFIYVTGRKRKTKMLFKLGNGLYQHVSPLDLKIIIQRDYGWEENFRISYIIEYLKIYALVDEEELYNLTFSTDALLFLEHINGRKWLREFLKRKREQPTQNHLEA